MNGPDKSKLDAALESRAARTRAAEATPPAAPGAAPGSEQGAAESAPEEGKNKGLVPTADALTKFVQKHQRDFELVVPKHMSPERVMRICIAALKRSPLLMECWLPSVVGGCLEASALGLELNTPLAEAWLIPFKNNKTKRLEAELIVGFEGYIKLMYNHEKVRTVFANTVHENDTFECVYGTEEKLRHVEATEGRGEIKGFYAYAKMTNDAYRFVYLPKAEVDRARDEFSPSYKADPKNSTWTTDYKAMGCKTAIRRLQKYVPKSAECARAIEADYQVIDPILDSGARTEERGA